MQAPGEFTIFYLLLTIAVEDLVSRELCLSSGGPAEVKPSELRLVLFLMRAPRELTIFYFLLTIVVEDLADRQLCPVAGWPAGVKPTEKVPDHNGTVMFFRSMRTIQLLRATVFLCF